MAKKIKNLSNSQKIEDFFSIHALIKTFGNDDLRDEDFLNNEK